MCYTITNKNVRELFKKTWRTFFSEFTQGGQFL